MSESGANGENASPNADFIAQLWAAKHGTNDDRASLLESFRDYLRAIATATIGKKRGGQLSASDVVQSAIIDAHGAFENCRAKTYAEFKAWLRQILMNDIVNRHRKLRSKKRDVTKERPIGSKLELADDFDSPSRHAIRGEDEERLVAALAKLPAEQRLVVELHQRDRMTFVAIGQQLDRTPGAIRAIWNRAIDALSKLLQENNDLPDAP